MTPSIALDATGACSTSLSSTKSSSPPDSFHQLVADLSQILGPSSGLTSADVDVQQLRSLMERYISNEDEWRRYAFADLSRGYTRNLVDEGNGKSNLVLESSPSYFFTLATAELTTNLCLVNSSLESRKRLAPTRPRRCALSHESALGNSLGNPIHIPIHLHLHLHHIFPIRTPALQHSPHNNKKYNLHHEPSNLHVR